MKSHFKTIAILCFGITTFVSCNKEDVENPKEYVPSAASFIAIKEQGIKAQTQSFSATAGTGLITLTSAKGVQISLDGNNLNKNGNPVTGTIDIKFIEIFDKGTMLVTNKSTMGKMADGNQSILKSGGEFYINATQGGVQLVSTGTIQLSVPANLSKTADPNMTFWAGNTTDPENIVWEKPEPTPNGGREGNVDFKQTNYTVTFGNFGWTNIDRFYSDPRPKTTILATVPSGYTKDNSAIYLSVDGEGQNQLAKLDTFNPTTQQFSEHYGQIPIGLQCHLIFVTENNGQWRYAIKGVTTTANAVFNFSLAETTVGTEAQFVTAINAIQ
jgi:hypothetical protein